MRAYRGHTKPYDHCRLGATDLTSFLLSLNLVELSITSHVVMSISANVFSSADSVRRSLSNTDLSGVCLSVCLSVRPSVRPASGSVRQLF